MRISNGLPSFGSDLDVNAINGMNSATGDWLSVRGKKSEQCPTGDNSRQSKQVKNASALIGLRSSGLGVKEKCINAFGLNALKRCLHPSENKQSLLL